MRIATSKLDDIRLGKVQISLNLIKIDLIDKRKCCEVNKFYLWKLQSLRFDFSFLFFSGPIFHVNKFSIIKILFIGANIFQFSTRLNFVPAAIFALKFISREN